MIALDPTSFDQLYQRRFAELRGLAQRVVGDGGEAEEVVQEAFVRLNDAGPRDRPDSEQAAWLRRVCLNLAFNRARDERRARERLERAARLEPEHAVEGPEREVTRTEEAAAVRRALATLPDRQRECLLLRHSGYSYAEIAATLEIAVGSVGVLLARGERAFREAYLERENG